MRSIQFALVLALAATACSSNPKVADQGGDAGASRTIASNDDRYVVFVDDGNKSEYRSIVFKKYPNGGGEIATCDKNKLINGVISDGNDRDKLYADHCKIEETFKNEVDYQKFSNKMKDYLVAHPTHGFAEFLVDTVLIGYTVYLNRQGVDAINDLVKALTNRKLKSLEGTAKNGVRGLTLWGDYFGRLFGDTRFYKTAEAAAQADKILRKSFKWRSGGTAVFTGITLAVIGSILKDTWAAVDENEETGAVKTVVTSINEAQKHAGSEPTKVNFTAFFQAMRSTEMGYPTWGELKVAK